MSDPAATPDPVDQAYVQAEAMLSDDEARAARRARVLAEVARQPAAAAPDARRPSRPSPWRRGGWLAAASVAGLAFIIASQMYRPFWNHLESRPAGSPAPTPAATEQPAPSSVATAPPAPSAAAAPRAATPVPAPAAGPPAARGPASPSDATASPAAEAAQPEQPAAPPPAPPAVAIASDRAAPAPQANASEAPSGGARDEAVAGPGVARGADRRMSSPALAAPPATSANGYASSAGAAADQSARLRAAAAAGRTSDIEALLDQGVPVDVPDAGGDTALMISIQANHPAAAALLRRHGASLDHRNRAGENARDLVAESGDAALEGAIGLPP
jgi:DNA polymerase-3 subunit gamma/tau